MTQSIHSAIMHNYKVSQQQSKLVDAHKNIVNDIDPSSKTYEEITALACQNFKYLEESKADLSQYESFVDEISDQSSHLTSETQTFHVQKKDDFWKQLLQNITTVMKKIFQYS